MYGPFDLPARICSKTCLKYSSTSIRPFARFGPLSRVEDRRVSGEGIPKFLPIQIVKRCDEFREEPVNSFLLSFGRARLRHQ